jgi:O-antigen/teichoic acid export membrane protein
VLWLIGPGLVDGVFKIPPELHDKAIDCMRLAALGLTINLLTPPVIAFLNASERFDIRARISITATIVSSVAVLWRGMAGDLVGAIVGQLSGSILALFLFVGACRRLDPDRVGPAMPSIAVFRALASFSFFQMLSSAMAQVVNNFSKFFLAARFGPSEVAWFGTPLSLAQRVPSMLAAAAGVLFPRVSAMSVAGQEQAIPKIYRISQKLLSTASLAICLPLSVMAGPLLTAWLGADFAAHAEVPLTVLAIAFAIGGTDVAMVHTMLGMGKPQEVVKTDILPAILNLGSLVLLIGPFGITGAAVAVLVGWCGLVMRARKIASLVGPEGTRGVLSLIAKVAVLATLSGLVLRPLATLAVPLGVLGPLSVIGISFLIVIGVVWKVPSFFGDDVVILDRLADLASDKLKSLRTKGDNNAL